ncbi:MAG TPA: TraR/DksA C4-type zinc finger protein [Acidimicrobiales bacterium]
MKKSPASKKAPAAVGAATKKTAASAKGAAAATSAKKATGPATRKAEAPAKTVFTPKPKPPAPVRPKTGPYAKDAKFLDEVKELLLAERAIYQEQATSLRAEADSLALEREPGDVQFDEESGEGGTVTVDRERNLALSGQATLAVEEIDDALARIVDKTYGYCERCYQPIPKPRLRALPYARLCVACKSGGLSRR